MNVLTIANAFGDGISGVDTVVRAYAKELIERGHNVNILARTRTSKSGWHQIENIPVYYVPTTVKRRSWSNIPYQAWAYFKKINDTTDALRKLGLTCDVLWMHYGTPDALWVGFKAFPDSPKIIHIHAIGTREFFGEFRKEFRVGSIAKIVSMSLGFLEKTFLSKTHAIITYSDWMKKMVERRIKKGIPIYVIHNPVNFELFNSRVKAYPRSALGLSEDDNVVLYVGKLNPLKGTEYLLKAARMLPNYRFLLVGRPVAMPEGYYEKIAPRNVIFHSPIPHNSVPEFMKMSDCYVQPTTRDGLEIPIAEALAVGKPVVTTDHEERREIYEDSVYYAKIGDTKSLANAINEAYDQGVKKGKERIIRKFDVKTNVDKLEEIFEMINR